MGAGSKQSNGLPRTGWGFQLGLSLRSKFEVCLEASGEIQLGKPFLRYARQTQQSPPPRSLSEQIFPHPTSGHHVPESQQDINITAEPSFMVCSPETPDPPCLLVPMGGRGIAMTTAEREEPLVIFDKMFDKAREERETLFQTLFRGFPTVTEAWLWEGLSLRWPEHQMVGPSDKEKEGCQWGLEGGITFSASPVINLHQPSCSSQKFHSRPNSLTRRSSQTYEPGDTSGSNHKRALP